MNRAATALAVALLIAGCGNLLTVSPPAETPPSTAVPSARPVGASALERQIHALVNERRTSQGLIPLRWDDRIAEIAREHSRAMAAGGRSFSHDQFDDRAARIGTLLSVRSIAENLAYDSRSGPALARQVVEGWIESPGHRQNIEGNFAVTGIGVAEAEDGVRYFTQIFVQTRD